MSKLKYTPPPLDLTKVQRRVYVLPTDLLRRMYDYGHKHSFPSEVEIVRHLLTAALDHLEQEITDKGKQA